MGHAYPMEIFKEVLKFPVLSLLPGLQAVGSPTPIFMSCSFAWSPSTLVWLSHTAKATPSPIPSFPFYILHLSQLRDQ